MERLLAIAGAIAALIVTPANARANDIPAPASGPISPACKADTAFASTPPVLLSGSRPLTALETMRLLQTTGMTSAPPVLNLAALIGPVEPAANGSRALRCAHADLVLPGTAPRIPVPLGPRRIDTDFLASKLLAVRHTALDSKWASAQGSISMRVATALVGGFGEGRRDRVARVNAWVNHAIRYRDDAELDRVADRWAPAPQTLRRRAGDCEDIAILKLHMLAALGIPQSDIYLTIARDLARAADHAVLVVRIDGEPVVLDNSTDALLDGHEANDYKPIVSFSGTGKWVHAFPVPAPETVPAPLA